MKLTVAARVAQRYVHKLAQCPCSHGHDEEATAGEVPEATDEHLAVAPPGWENTVKHMKKHDEIDNPWALAWYMKDKGDKSHK